MNLEERDILTIGHRILVTIIENNLINSTEPTNSDNAEC